MTASSHLYIANNVQRTCSEGSVIHWHIISDTNNTFTTLGFRMFVSVLAEVTGGSSTTRYQYMNTDLTRVFPLHHGGMGWFPFGLCCWWCCGLYMPVSDSVYYLVSSTSITVGLNLHTWIVCSCIDWPSPHTRQGLLSLILTLTFCSIVLCCDFLCIQLL